MSLDPRQFRDLIERRLKIRVLVSRPAVALLLGTAAQESAFGTFLRQKGEGPALGVFQMEPATFRDLRSRWRIRFPEIRTCYPEQLEWDLDVAIFFARLKYLDTPSPLPGYDDLAGMAAYWKKFYNSPLGAGTESQFIDNWRLYALERIV